MPTNQKQNPFQVGDVVIGANFADRSSIKKELLLDMRSHQNIILHGIRRIGKTSLVSEVFRILELESNFKTIYLDLVKLDSIEKLGSAVINKLAGTSEKFIEATKTFFKDVNISIKDNKVSIGRIEKESNKTELLSNILEYIGKKSEKNTVVVVFDEFQLIEQLVPSSLERIRSIVQHQKNVSYIFTGSDASLIDFFIDVDHPFYRFGKLLTLDKPNKEEITNFIIQKFKNSKRIISGKNVNLIIDISKNIPYFTMYVAHDLWNMAEINSLTQIEDYHIRNVIQHILERNNSEYEKLWLDLKINQRKTLQLVIQTDKIFSDDRPIKITNSNLQKSLNSLVKRQLLRRISVEGAIFEILDPIFELWIKDSFLQ